MIDVSIVIPVYRSGNTLPELLHRMSRMIEDSHCSHEVILVDDSDDDQTWSVLSGIVVDQPYLTTAIQLASNVGQHNALNSCLCEEMGLLAKLFWSVVQK